MFLISPRISLQCQAVLWLEGRGPLGFLLAGWVVGVKSQTLHVISTRSAFASDFPEEELPGHKTTRLVLRYVYSYKPRKKQQHRNQAHRPATAAPEVSAWCTCWREATVVLVCVRVFSSVSFSQDSGCVFTWEEQRGAPEVGSALSRSAEH